MAVYDTSYREAEVVATAACTDGDIPSGLVGVALEMSSS